MAGGAARLCVRCSAATGRCASPRGSLGAFIAFHAIASHKRAIVGAHKAVLPPPSPFFARPALLLKRRCSRAPVSGDTSTHATARVLCVVTDSAWCGARSMHSCAPWDHCAAGCAMQEHSCALVPTYSCPWSINVLLSTITAIRHVIIGGVGAYPTICSRRNSLEVPQQGARSEKYALEPGSTVNTDKYNTFRSLQPCTYRYIWNQCARMVLNRFSYERISMLRLRYSRISFGSVTPDFAVKFAVRPRFTREERVVGETTPRDRHQWVLTMCCEP